MKPGDLKRRLRAGETVVGLLSPNTEGYVIEAAGFLGFDLYLLDTEHGTAGPSEVAQVVRVCDTAGMAAVVRARSLDPKLILQLLGAEMTGIMLPGARSVEEVSRLVSPDNDFANALPRFISFKTGGLLTDLIGIAMQPWRNGRSTET